MAPTDITAASAPASASAPRPLRVLVADDDDDFRASIVAALRCDGYTTAEASAGDELLANLEAARASPDLMPDVLVTDVKMPVLSGFSVLAALLRARVSLPVVVVTALTQESLHAVASGLGAIAFLRKPFDVDDLRTAVTNAVTLHARRRRSGD